MMGEAVIIDKKKYLEIKKEIEKNKNNLIVFSCEDEKIVRMVLEKGRVDIFLPKFFSKKDFLRQRNSSFNDVLAKICKKRKISVGIDLSELLNSVDSGKSRVLARIRQNITICKKNGLFMDFVSRRGEERNIRDLKSLALVLGMPTNFVKKLGQIVF